MLLNPWFFQRCSLSKNSSDYSGYFLNSDEKKKSRIRSLKDSCKKNSIQSPSNFSNWDTQLMEMCWTRYLNKYTVLFLFIIGIEKLSKNCKQSYFYVLHKGLLCRMYWLRS